MFSLTLQPSHRLAIFIAETRPTYPNFSHFEASISCTESPVKNPVLISIPYPKLYNPKAMLFTAAYIGVTPAPCFKFAVLKDFLHSRFLLAIYLEVKTIVREY